MSVNIFGSSGKFSHNINKRYVDQKFTTLSTNLASKVNRSGDSLTGDLNILLNEDTLRTFGVGDIASGKSVSLLLGDVDNQLRHNFGYAWKLIAAYGIKFFCAAGEVCWLGTQHDPRAKFFQGIIMNNNSITGLRDPADSQDATTKRYVDTRCVKNSAGYIPSLISNEGNGFIVSASIEITEFTVACNVFNSTRGEWLSGDLENFWIQIRCPERVRVHKFAIKGVQSGTIRSWKLQASNNDNEWIDLYDNLADAHGRYIDHNFYIYEKDSIIKYSTYRIWISHADGELPGLSYWQLYTVDELV